MGVGREGKTRIGNEEAAGHTEMNDPLGPVMRGGRFAGLRIQRAPFAGLRVRRERFAVWPEGFVAGCGRTAPGGRHHFKIDNDVLADAVDAGDAAAGESLGENRGRSFERLPVGGKPCGEDDVAAEAAIDTVGDGLDFGELGHWATRTTNAEEGWKNGRSSRIPGESP